VESLPMPAISDPRSVTLLTIHDLFAVSVRC